MLGYLIQVPASTNLLYYVNPFLALTNITLNNITLLSISLLDVNFNKSIVGLDFLLVLYMLTKFHDDLRSIIMSLIKCLNLNFFLNLKIVHKRWPSKLNSK